MSSLVAPLVFPSLLNFFSWVVATQPSTLDRISSFVIGGEDIDLDLIGAAFFRPFLGGDHNSALRFGISFV